MRQRILVKFPTRGRPAQAIEVLRGWAALASGNHDVVFLVTIDADDATMGDPSVRAAVAAVPGAEVLSGLHRSKVEAFNSGLAGRAFDILVAASDDMVAQARGYDDVIAADMRTAYPDLDGALHYYDGYTGTDRLITLSIMGRRLFDRFGYVYHPAYRSYFCDNEFTDVVKALGRVTFSAKQLFHHDHNGHRPDDAYRRNDLDFARDAAVYERRRRAGFGLSGPGGFMRGCAMDPYGTHLPVLVKALMVTGDGPVLELGCGDYSTPVLMEACYGRELLSLESDRDVADRFAACAGPGHEVRWVMDWDRVELTDRVWDVVLVDHSPPARRGTDIERLARHAKLIVVHDSEDLVSCGYERALAGFRYRADYKRLTPWTSVVSNIFDDFTRFFGPPPAAPGGAATASGAPGGDAPTTLKDLCLRHGVAVRGVIQLGAHEGQELEEFHELGPSHVLLVEANPDAFGRLRRHAAGFPEARAVCLAASDVDGQATLHVTSADASSSLLPLKRHAEYYPHIREIAEVAVRACRVDSLLAELGLDPSLFNLMHLDIQGGELAALRGAGMTLERIQAVYTEVSFVELYEGAPLAAEVDAYLSARGFDRVYLGMAHETWGDAFYVRSRPPTGP